MARPKKEAHASRSERLNLRLTADERAEIEAKAAAAGVPASDYARRAVLGDAVASVRIELADPALVVALNRAGVNLNQIARALNSGQGLAPAELSDTLGRINGFLDQLQGLQ